MIRKFYEYSAGFSSGGGGIAAQDLRIGNWVKTESVGNTQIIELRHGCCGIDGGDLPYKDYYNKIEPIPLTPELLLACGFVNNKSYKHIFHLKAKWRVKLSDSKKGNTFFRGGEIIKHSVQYLHQLQNLYYALTDQELNIDMQLNGASPMPMPKEQKPGQ